MREGARPHAALPWVHPNMVAAVSSSIHWSTDARASASHRRTRMSRPMISADDNGRCGSSRHHRRIAPLRAAQMGRRAASDQRMDAGSMPRGMRATVTMPPRLRMPRGEVAKKAYRPYRIPVRSSPGGR